MRSKTKTHEQDFSSSLMNSNTESHLKRTLKLSSFRQKDRRYCQLSATDLKSDCSDVKTRERGEWRQTYQTWATSDTSLQEDSFGKQIESMVGFYVNKMMTNRMTTKSEGNCAENAKEVTEESDCEAMTKRRRRKKRIQRRVGLTE